MPVARATRNSKGPYYANVGHFGAVGSVNIQYRDTIPDQAALSVGTLGYQRLSARVRSHSVTATCWVPWKCNITMACF
jgi:hypothetical protein